MKTGKITEIKQVKEWNGGNGVVYYHQLVMDNGDKIEIGKKSQLSIGDELNYEITDTSGQHEFSKAKNVNPDFQKTQPSGDNLKGIKIGHALNCASVIFSGAGSSVSDQQLEEMAIRIYRISDKLNNEL